MKKIITIVIAALILSGCINIPLAVNEKEVKAATTQIIIAETETEKAEAEAIRIKAEIEAAAKAEAEEKARIEAEVIPQEKAKTETPTKINNTSKSSGNAIVNQMPANLKKYFKGFSIGTVTTSWASAEVDPNNPSIIHVKNDSVLSNNYVIWHEMAHTFDLSQNIAEMARWQDIYNREWAGTNVYGATNIYEAFAESVAGNYLGRTGSYYGSGVDNKPLSVQFVKEALGIVKTEMTTKIAQNEEIKDNGAQLTKEHNMISNVETVLYDKINGNAIKTVPAGTQAVLVGSANDWDAFRIGGSVYWAKHIMNGWKYQ